MGAAVRDLACLRGGSKWQPACWQTWFAALETVIVTGKCHCAGKEGERNFSLFAFLEILRVGIVAAVRSWELALNPQKVLLKLVFRWFFFSKKGLAFPSSTQIIADHPGVFCFFSFVPLNLWCWNWTVPDFMALMQMHTDYLCLTVWTSLPQHWWTGSSVKSNRSD